MIYKKLVKEMTYDEIKVYVKNHPKWRLPNKDESKYLFDITKEAHYIDNKDVLTDIVKISNGGYVHKLFKLTVLLVPSIKDIITGTNFIVDNEVIKYIETDDGHSSLCFTRKQVSDVLEIKDDKVIRQIFEIMSNNDTMTLLINV